MKQRVNCLCVDKKRDSKGNIEAYKLKDRNGNIRVVEHKQLKQLVANGTLNVLNLQIDKAGRLVDKAYEAAKTPSVDISKLKERINYVFDGGMDDYDINSYIKVATYVIKNSDKVYKINNNTFCAGTDTVAVTHKRFSISNLKVVLRLMSYEVKLPDKFSYEFKIKLNKLAGDPRDVYWSKHNPFTNGQDEKICEQFVNKVENHYGIDDVKHWNIDNTDSISGMDSVEAKLECIFNRSGYDVYWKSGYDCDWKHKSDDPNTCMFYVVRKDDPRRVEKGLKFYLLALKDEVETKFNVRLQKARYNNVDFDREKEYDFINDLGGYQYSKLMNYNDVNGKLDEENYTEKFSYDFIID